MEPQKFDKSVESRGEGQTSHALLRRRRLSRVARRHLLHPQRLTDIKDGTSTTFLYGELYHRDREFDRLTLALDPSFYPLASWGAWASAYHKWGSEADVLLGTPVPINYLVPPGLTENDEWWVPEENRLNAFGSGHSHGANFAFADGSVRFVNESIPLSMLQALSTRDGGEVADVP